MIRIIRSLAIVGALAAIVVSSANAAPITPAEQGEYKATQRHEFRDVQVGDFRPHGVLTQPQDSFARQDKRTGERVRAQPHIPPAVARTLLTHRRALLAIAARRQQRFGLCYLDDAPRNPKCAHPDKPPQLLGYRFALRTDLISQFCMRWRALDTEDTVNTRFRQPPELGGKPSRHRQGDILDVSLIQ